MGACCEQQGDASQQRPAPKSPLDHEKAVVKSKQSIGMKQEPEKVVAEPPKVTPEPKIEEQPVPV